VQGVGFRYTAEHTARRHRVAGDVRNLPDGRVELVMEGPDKALDAVMRDLQEHMSANIKDVETSGGPATGEFPDFTIR
jgi:acylphosphatase